MQSELLKHLYSQMLRIRMVEEKIAELYSEQEMRCPVHLSIGQEAIAIGVCANLKKEDYVLSAHRSHAHYLAKGGDLRRMLGELYGKSTGCAQGKGGSMHLIDINAGFLAAVPIVGSTIPIAVGTSWGSVMKGEDKIVAVFFGDGSIEEGVFHESLNFAALKKLPILFICEHNQYSVYSHIDTRQPSNRSITSLARSHGITCYQGNGNDVEEVHQLTQEAIQETRKNGPVFLELETYRWLEHCGPHDDDHLGYRSENELNEWKKKCPITKLERYFKNDRIINNGDLKKIRTGIETEIIEAFQFAKESPFPTEQNLYEHVYAL